MTREEVINNMCMTWRHDYGLLDESEQKSLFNRMAQVFDNDIAGELMTQNDLEDYEEKVEELEHKLKCAIKEKVPYIPAFEMEA